MSITQIISEFLAHRFPCWGACHINFDPSQRTLYLFCRIPGRYSSLLQDIEAIAHLDIGIKQFVVRYPEHTDLVIESVPDYIGRDIDG